MIKTDLLYVSLEVNEQSLEDHGRRHDWGGHQQNAFPAEARNDQAAREGSNEADSGHNVSHLI